MKKMSAKKIIERAEDFYDTIIVESRHGEKSIPFEKVVRKLRKKGKL